MKPSSMFGREVLLECSHPLPGALKLSYLFSSAHSSFFQMKATEIKKKKNTKPEKI